jgi:DNA-binding HxlR family transcriptional regulator
MSGYDKQVCETYRHAVTIIGKRWTGLILLVLMDGPFRFNELSAALRPVSDRVLSERLKELEREGIVLRKVYAETPVRVEYNLTEKGQALGPVIEALEEWGQRWVNIIEEATETK